MTHKHWFHHCRHHRRGGILFSITIPKMGITITGVSPMALVLTDVQQVSVSVAGEDAEGNPAPLTGPIGFYPVVHDAAWVQRLLDWGVRTVQLRFKAAGHTPAEIERPLEPALDVV